MERFRAGIGIVGGKGHSEAPIVDLGEWAEILVSGVRFLRTNGSQVVMARLRKMEMAYRGKGMCQNDLLCVAVFEKIQNQARLGRARLTWACIGGYATNTVVPFRLNRFVYEKGH